VCTAQLCEYRDRWADFTAAGVQVVGINPSGHERHGKFAANHRFPFPLLSDPDNACCKAYGAKAWYGTRRQVVLIDQQGQERWRDVTFPFFRPKADALLAAVKQHLG
jgi:peroxiredoxin Q/BCP